MKKRFTAKYLRRKMLIANVEGALASTENILWHIRETNRPPRWLIESATSITKKLALVRQVLIRYRNVVQP